VHDEPCEVLNPNSKFQPEMLNSEPINIGNKYIQTIQIQKIKRAMGSRLDGLDR